MRGVQLIGPGRAGVFVNLVPLFGALMAVGLLGEPFAAYHVLALVLVVGGIAIAQRGASGLAALTVRRNARGDRHERLDRTEAKGRFNRAWRADPQARRAAAS